MFTVAVFGDSLADGVWTGVYRQLSRDDRFQVLRRARVSSGLARPDFYNWQQALEEFLAADDIDAAVISVGLNDTQPVYHNGRWDHGFGTERWDEIYAARVEAMMARLDAAGIPTFWLGLPVVRSNSYASKVRHINVIFEATAAGREGVTFVPMWQATADENGAYSSYLEDSTGRSRLMRANDGIHFTVRGYELVAGHLLAAMRRELAVFNDTAPDE